MSDGPYKVVELPRDIDGFVPQWVEDEDGRLNEEELAALLNAQHRQIEELNAVIERLRGALAVYENPPEMRAVPKRKIKLRGKVKHVGKLRPRQIDDDADHANE